MDHGLNRTGFVRIQIVSGGLVRSATSSPRTSAGSVISVTASIGSSAKATPAANKPIHHHAIVVFFVVLFLELTQVPNFPQQPKIFYSLM
jgi:hypothetical protein